MVKLISTQITLRVIIGAALLCLSVLALGQTPKAPVVTGRGVIRLRVRVAADKPDAAKGLSRKRFFLIKGSKEENKSLLASFEQRPVASRDCYYRGIGASEALITWLKQGDGCESVYCREVDPKKDIEGAAAVPEFQRAVAAGEKEYGSHDLAVKWLAVNLPENLLSGFYKQQTRDLQAFIKQAELLSRARVLSAMTDQNGTAYFTDLDPGTYVISNILPIEVGGRAMFWNSEIKVKPGDLATEKIFLISNSGNKSARDVKSIKDVAIEKPLPACPAVAK